MEERNVCFTIFLGVTQAFDKFWHDGPFHKIEQLLPAEYSQLLKSYLSDGYFRFKKEDEYSSFKQVKAGVPQGMALGPVLHRLYTSDLPQPEEATMTSLADDSATMAVGDSVEEPLEKLRREDDKENNWTRKWLMTMNEAKSVHADFTNKTCQRMPISRNDKVIRHSNTNLGMALDAKLRWEAHVRKKNAKSLN